MEILIRDLETPKPKRFMDLEIGDTLYCIFCSYAIVPITIKNIIWHDDSSVTFVGSKERLIGHEPPGDYDWNNIRWRIEYYDINSTICFDASTTLQDANKILRCSIAANNKYLSRQYVKKMLKY